MLDEKFSEQLKKDYQTSETERRQIIALANIVLHESKRVIFALHRGERQKAEIALEEIEKTIAKLENQFGYERIIREGAYSAATEEYIEAKTLSIVLDNKKIEEIENLKFPTESYLGGICDLTGELVRYAINEAAKGNYEKVSEAKENINQIIGKLIEFDMTGYLRTKYDQAKGNLRKIEQIDYEIKLRGRSNNA